ncbi:MAG TPA: glycosyltransferase family 39 protein [Candidatus Saccharimonadales bacterium]|nr:glycosyltransferase family 39 protein [Candidatus Saccharimonadales bacterium]
MPGYHPVFFNSDGGREALYAYIVAGVFRVFGSSVLTLRGTAAALGVMGVIATYFAVRRFGRGPALLAMLWTAGSLWMIAVSRDGFRNIITVLVGAAALALLLRWGDRPSRGIAVLAGAAIALGFWTYQPLKLLPVLTILWLLWIRARDRQRFSGVLATWRWAAVAFLVVAAPMIVTAITDTSGYFGRAASVSAIFAGAGSPDSYPVHVLRTVAMFLITGDPNERHDVHALPLLGPVLFVAFALGIWRCWRRRDDHGHALVLLGLVVFLLPPLLATEGFAPHFLRSLGLAPYVAACIGLGCVEAVDIARRFAPRLSSVDAPTITRIAWCACAFAVTGVGIASAVTYVNRPIEDRYSPFTFADVALARAAVNNATDGGPSTLLILDSYDAMDVQFLDAGRVPTIIEPMRSVGNPAVYTLVVAPSVADIAAAVGAPLAAEAHVVATDPSGTPVAFEVVPEPTRTG